MKIITCYPTPGKAKAAMLCEAFAEGAAKCGISVRIAHSAERLSDGAAVFYGVTPETAHLWHQAKTEGRDWYYIDNSYFDCGRGVYFRVTKNALQYLGEPWNGSDGVRLQKLGVKIAQSSTCGKHIVVCVQSDSFMRTFAGMGAEEWLSSITPALRATGRDIRVRRWSADKPRQGASLTDDLRGAWALATYNSAAAIEAVIAGVPAYCTGPTALGALASPQIGHPLASAQRVSERLAVLADRQWTLDEMRAGVAWRGVNA